MKTPLRYQITEFDCASASLTNCISYLFDREEIPAELIKIINAYTLDCYDKFGNLGNKGTSREVVEYLSKWIVQYGENNNFNIRCKYVEKENVSLDLIKEWIKNKGCVNVRTYCDGVEHYVTITNIKNKFVYIFDPYYIPEKNFNNNTEVFFEHNPFKYNRKVSLERFTSLSPLDFSLGPIEKRECVLVSRT